MICNFPILQIHLNKKHQIYSEQDRLSTTPMLLVQGIDMYNIYKNWTECWDITRNDPNCDVGIAYSNDTIPKELKKVIASI